MDKEKTLFLKERNETGHCIITGKQSAEDTRWCDQGFVDNLRQYKDRISGWAQF